MMLSATPALMLILDWIVITSSIQLIIAQRGCGGEACEECSDWVAGTGEEEIKQLDNNRQSPGAGAAWWLLGGVLTSCWRVINHCISHAACTLGDLFISNLSYNDHPLEWWERDRGREKCTQQSLHLEVGSENKNRYFLFFLVHLSYKSPQRPMGILVIRTNQRKNITWLRIIGGFFYRNLQ